MNSQFLALMNTFKLRMVFDRIVMVIGVITIVIAAILVLRKVISGK